MKVVEIHDAAALRDLRPAWNRLLSASAANTIFLTWEWLTAWWSSYGTGELQILAVFDDEPAMNDHALRGIAAFERCFVRKYRQTVSALSLLGDGSNDSDYLDFIIARGYEQQVLEAFRAWLGARASQGTVFLLNEIPENSSSLLFLRELAGTHHALWKESDVRCGIVGLPQTWEEYVGILKPRFRTRVRSVLRNLEGRPEVRFGFCETAEEMERMLPVLFDLHTRRWAEDGKAGVFRWDRKRSFYFALSRLLLETGWLRFSWLKWNGRILACQYGFAYNNVYFHLQEGYEPASEHWNVGIGLRAWTMREFIRQGLREYDFLGGIGRHKTDWGAVAKQSKRVLLAKPTHQNFLYCYGPEWETRAREVVAKLVPERILAARRNRLQNQAAPLAPANGNGATTSDSTIRKVAAHLYASLRLTALARPLRERYQLTLRPKPSWTKRTAPSGRILYYHRVNDEGDPFFPSHPTHLFERQMEYLARNYRVVSLGEMLDRLEGGKPENLVTITFDDGYQDNYQNALPILERYGLPATIFLATGSIDSREPLWFERLALAVKKTEREFIDLETDFPRRFRLRTQAERLQANDGIFQVLKGLPDEERRCWLEEVLHQLAADDAERRNKMLTWDQVRLMKRRGIDFGGHTVSHPFVSRLTREQLTWEVSECKRRIEEELQSPVRHFAYPNGREGDFNGWNQELIRNAGYHAALTTIWGLNYPSTDRMELKRGQPWEKDVALFAYKLDWYQLVNG